MSGCPYICMPSIHLYAPICLYAPRGVHPPCSPYSSVLYVLRGFCILWGVVRGPFTCGTLPLHLPLYWGTSPSVVPPLSCWLPCASVGFRDIGMSYGEFPFCLGLVGYSPSIGSAGGISTCDVHILILVHFCSSLCLTFLLRL